MVEDSKKMIEKKDKEIGEKVAEMIRKQGLSNTFKKLGISEDIITKVEKEVSEGEKQKPAILASASKGVSGYDAFQLAKEKGMRLLSNKELDEMLQSGEWKNYEAAFPAWSGTMVAYSKPGEKLGESIKYTDSESKETWEFPVPAKFRGMKDCALVAEKYRLFRDGMDVIVVADDKDIKIVKDFPSKNGWYKTDEVTGISSGKEAEERDKDARYLYRDDFGRVGPVARDYYLYYNWRIIDVDDRPSDRLGVLGVKDSPGGAAAEKKE